jgi:CheY-like chemotaxis protein/anti-sigma regulatory factor (Ser/Thr protein kinase)
MVRPLAAERSIRLHCDLPVADVIVSASAKRLKQVLLNLLANAVKYSPRGADVTVIVRDPGNGRACIEVVDTGPGIPPDQVERAFVPFERLGPPGDVEGTGLGLPLSRNLVEAMAGSLTVASGPGGSTFTVELARAGSDDGAPPDQAGDPGAGGDDGAGPSAGHRLLYIEENDSNVALVERLAERRGDLELHATNRGDAGVDLARRLRPDVVVLDLHLPDTTGYDVLSALRAADETRDVPVIVVSADVTQDHEPRVTAAGATAYLTKPLDLARLQAEIDRALGA